MRYDWDRLYYAIVEERVVNGCISLKVIATGEDKLSTKRKAAEKVSHTAGKGFSYVEAYLRMLERLDVGQSVAFGEWHKIHRLVLMDAKTYVYGNLLGFDNIRFGYEPLLETPVLIYISHEGFKFGHCVVGEKRNRRKRGVRVRERSTRY